MSTAAAAKRTAEQVLGKDKIVSSDSHIMEPPDLWEANLTPSLKPKFPKFPPRNNPDHRARAGSPRRAAAPRAKPRTLHVGTEHPDRRW